MRMEHVESRADTQSALNGARVYIVVLNWNGWKDTIECLESVFRSDAVNYRVIVCDNDSKDESLMLIKAWADGYLDVALHRDHGLRKFTFPPLNKPIAYLEYDRGMAESGGHPDGGDAKLVLIQTGSNLGFAGGNNVGLRYALTKDDFDYVWLLNNDTIIRPDALSQMIARMQQMPSAGICGSTLLYYSMPGQVQAWGGAKYNKWLGTTKMLGAFTRADGPVDINIVESKLAFISGASMLVSKPFLEQIGLMREDYFLYFEEIDWAMRAKGQYQLCYAAGSVVYHKEGGSIGTNSVVPKEKSLTADYYGVRSRLLFTRYFFPWCLPSIYLGLLPVLINRLRRGQWQRVSMILLLASGIYKNKS